MSVLVLAEGAPSLELVEEARTVARALAVPLVVYVAGAGGTAAPPALKDAREGDKLVTVSGLDAFSADAWLATFAAVLGKQEIHVVTMADTAHARAFFPALAARLHKPLLSGATRVRVLPPSHHHSRLHLEIERPLHGGLQTERLLVEAPLFVTLVASGGTGATTQQITSTTSALPSATPTRTASAKLETEAAPPLPQAARDRVARVLAPSADTVDIRSADRIVAGGFGLGSKEAVALLPRLAKLLHAAVGGTRVISDRGWLPHERYIGSTGKTVAPKLYLALGISGASQHLVGMTDSETIVAINTDRAAPIFGVADLGVVGDLHAIVPELEKRLEQHPGEPTT
jgi:electron transfer flavoprotein alpha subunit